MGAIFNIRGAAGSGKTEIVRRILSASSHRRELTPVGAGSAPPPASLIRHAGRELAILGAYGERSGGCDRITASQGGIAAALALAERLASERRNVVLEGLHLSWDVFHTRRLAAAARVVVLRLDTTAEQCAAALARRRRKGAAALPALLDDIRRQELAIDAACRQLCDVAAVRRCGFDEAIAAILSHPHPTYVSSAGTAAEARYGR
jgi:hypothetical protein